LVSSLNHQIGCFALPGFQNAADRLCSRDEMRQKSSIDRSTMTMDEFSEKETERSIAEGRCRQRLELCFVWTKKLMILTNVYRF
jgi:hypothetical protein